MQLPGVATRGSSLSGLCEVLGHPEAVPAQAGSWLWACTWPPHWLPGLCTRKSSTSGGEQWALFLVLLPTVYMLVDLPLGGQTGTWAEPVLGHFLGSQVHGGRRAVSVITGAEGVAWIMLPGDGARLTPAGSCKEAPGGRGGFWEPASALCWRWPRGDRSRKAGCRGYPV